MGKATSLIELILKKWGDDAAKVAAPAAGVAAAGQSDDADAGFITKGGKTLLEAWHGSPHKFDKFSMDQIGTGEGAQAYGHGLYFADEIDVAKGYQPRDRANEDWMYEQYKAAEEAGDQYMMDAWERAMMHDSPIELRASAADPDYDEYSQAAFAEVADALSSSPGTGSLSKVEIDVTPESLLDYDKPLSEQSDVVQRFFAGKEGISPDTNGRALTESLLKNRDQGLSLKELQKIASQEMSDGGIKGVQYQDWVNQAQGSDIRNYVIHDDSLINIAERGNADPRLLAGTAAGTAGLAGLLAAGQSGDADAGPLTAAAKALLDKNFTESAVRSATDMAAAHKSREALTTMNIDEFLNLAQKGYAPDKFGALQSVDKFDEVPFLSIGYRDGSDGVAHVTGHEGRHRAMTLKSRGETQMPVRVRGDIRWDQQDTPNFDYVDDWPALLASQNEGITSPFPFKRGDSNLLDSSDMALRSKYTPPKKPEPKPDSYDTEILAELLDEFNFEKGNADPRLLAGTAAGTAGLMAAPMLADKDKPLPVPTWGDVGESVGGVLSMPMTGLQGIARGLYGLATGEDIVTAGAEAAGVMGSEHKGSLMTPGMDSDKGADRMEKYVTEKTGDESLGWLTKMGLLLGGI